jgi:prepilin-type processing-associated H-X9-DG protein
LHAGRLESVSFFQRVLRVVAAPGRGAINLIRACYKRLASREQPSIEGASPSSESSWFPEKRTRWTSVIEPPAWIPEAGRFTLVELLVTVALTGVSTALLVPGVVKWREAQRRAQCTNNLMQLGIAVSNYTSSNGCLPGNSYSGTEPWQSQYPNFSCFVRLTPFLHRQDIFNATNFNLTNYDPENITIAGIQINTLMCPSDPWQPTVISASTPNASFVADVSELPPGTWYQQFTSYGGNQGTFPGDYRRTYGQDEFKQYNGVIYNDSSTKLAEITDGTSNTLLFGERAQTLFTRFDPDYRNSNGSWNSHRWFDTMITTYFPPNVATSGANVGHWRGAYPTVAASLHPGGVNFVFCDGSVRFIKDSINSWQFQPDATASQFYSISLPVGVVYTNYIFRITPGVTLPGVYQALSTRSGGEVIDRDEY